MNDYPHIACYKPDDWSIDQWREQIRTTKRRITCGQNDYGKYCYVYDDYWEALREWERQNKLKIEKMRPIIAEIVAKQQDSLNQLGKDYDISADWLIYEFGKQFRAIERKKERGQ